MSVETPRRRFGILTTNNGAFGNSRFISCTKLGSTHPRHLTTYIPLPLPSVDHGRVRVESCEVAHISTDSSTGPSEALKSFSATGEKVWATANEHRDLFSMAAGSFGSLGVITMLEMELIDAKRHVELQYIAVKRGLMMTRRSTTKRKYPSSRISSGTIAVCFGAAYELSSTSSHPSIASHASFWTH
jgi:hypothetical protein